LPQPGDIVVGSPQAPVAVVEYASLTCPHCARFHSETLPAFGKGWIDTGKAKLVYRHFPLDQAGLAAALAVSCLSEGKRADALAKLYADQAWSTEKDPAVGALARIAAPDEVVAVMECMAKPESGVAAVAPALAARKNGIDGTPTFVVSGKRHVGTVTAAELGAMVDAAIAEEFAR
jgi:protein-disulfide isomerase